MKTQYYPETDSLYVDIRDSTSVDSEEIAPGVVADYDERGNLVGLDIDRALRNRYVTPEMVLESLTEHIRALQGWHISSRSAISDLLSQTSDLRNALAHQMSVHELLSNVLRAQLLASFVFALGDLSNDSLRHEVLSLLEELRQRTASISVPGNEPPDFSHRPR